MIQEPDIKNIECRFEPLGQADIRQTRLSRAGRMVVRENHRSGIALKGSAKLNRQTCIRG